MAEVGALRVSLALDSANFSRSVTDINRKLRAVDSEFKATASSSKVFGNSLETLKARQDMLVKKFDLQKAKVAELKREYDESVATKGKDAKETENLAIRYNQAVAQMNKLEGQLKSVNTQIEQQSNKWNQLSERLSQAGEKLKSAGERMTSIGKDLSMKITAPLTAMGAGAFKMAVDFESSFAGVRKTVNTTEEGFKRLEKGIRDMAKQLPASANEIAGVAEMAGQLGIAEENILSFTRTIIDLGEATNLSAEQGATELARFANIVNMSQSDFDRLGSSLVGLGNTMATTESEIMSMSLRLAAQGAQVGMTEAQILALAGAMSSLGIQSEMGGTAMTTILKKIQTAVGEGGEALQGFAQVANMSSEEFKKAFETDAVSALDAFIKGLAKSSEEGANLTTILGELGIKGVYESDVLLRLAGASDLLSEAVATSTKAWQENTALSDEASQRYETTASQMAMLKNQIVDVGISLGQTLIPMASKAMEKIGEFANKFANMDENTKKAIVTIGAVTAVIPPLIVLGGQLVTSIGAIAGVASKLTAIMGAGGLTGALGAKGLAGSFALLTNPIGLTVAGLAAVTAGGIALYKHLQKESIPEIERFGDSVSESTQQAVGAFMDLNDQATVALNQLSWSGQEVTAEMATSITDNFKQMGDQILQGLEEKQGEQLESMKTFFANAKGLTEQEQAEILSKVQEGQEQQRQKIEEGQARITEILNTAKEEKRAITEAERDEINAIQQQMLETGIRVLSENEMEQKVILERMKQNASIITAEQAAEVVRNSVEQKEKVIAEAEQQYNDTIAEIIRLRDEAGTISEEQADKLIEEAQRQRDETIANAEEMHSRVVEEAQKQADEHVNLVDWETGEILSKWQVFKNKTSQTFREMWNEYKRDWNSGVEYLTQKATEIKDNAVRKFEELKTNALTKFRETKDNMLKPINEAKEQIGKIIDDIKKFFSNMKLKIPKIELPKLPKFNLTGNFSLNPPSVPKISVTWHKTGGVFVKPVIYGNAGFGDVEEAIVPFEGSHADKIAGLIAKSLDKIKASATSNNTNNNLTIEVPVYLDGYEIARVTTPYINDFQSNDFLSKSRMRGVKR